MRTIETTAIVTSDHTITVQLPTDIPMGQCRVVVVVDPPVGEKPFPFNLPVYDVGPWPEGFTVSREQIYDEDGR